MDALPQVGQKYQHKKWGEVEVVEAIKRGRGHSVEFFFWCPDGIYTESKKERLKDFQKATA